MKKRTLSLFLAIFFLFSLLPTTTYAVTDSGSCGRGVTWKYQNGTLIIYGYGPMDNYYTAPWDKYRTEITTVRIEDGVTSIGNYVFKNCESLTSVSIPYSVTTIGDSAFYYCTSLAAVTIPNSVTKIGGSAFRYCDSLTSITIPGSVRAIEWFAFANCLNLKTVKILDGVNRIEDYAFAECARLENVSLPKSLRSIYGCAFTECTSLFSITIPENVDRIEDFAFNTLSHATFLGDAPAQFDNYAMRNVITAEYPSYRNWPRSFLLEHSYIHWMPYDTPITNEPPATIPPVIEPPISAPDSNLPSIMGTYTTDLIFPASDLGVPSYIADSVIRATLVFTNDGNVSMTWQAINLTALRLYFHELFVNAYYAMAYGAGMTDINSIEAYCVASTGMSVDAYVNTIVTHNAMQAAFTPAPTSGTYTYNDGHTAILTDLPILNISSNTSTLNTFNINGNTLYLNAASWGKPDYTFVCTAK